MFWRRRGRRQNRLFFFGKFYIRYYHQVYLRSFYSKVAWMSSFVSACLVFVTHTQSAMLSFVPTRRRMSSSSFPPSSSSRNLSSFFFSLIK
jgi:hypothetical protein